MDVQTAGDFVKAGAKIQVIDVDGTRLLVKEFE
jgi:membrane-bound ClpP family serine protease